MSDSGLSSTFLREAAGKHFVFLTYYARGPGEEAAERLYHASCFVVAFEGLWWLMTAGHVIKDITDNTAKGVTYSTFRLQDKLAGNNYPLGVPYDFDLREWIVIYADINGTDYAIAPLTELIASNLKAGGVEPIRENGWGTMPFDQYSDWLLVGMPDESYRRDGDRHSLALTAIPLEPTECPPGLLNPPVNKNFGRLIERPELDTASVESVVGMSGGPIFGVKRNDASQTAEYWAIGVQSGWLATHRVVAFCPLPAFLEGFKRAVQELKRTAAPSTNR